MMADEVLLLEAAAIDLFEGKDFYDRQRPRLGIYFFDSLISDIESLKIYAGIHSVHFGFHRMLSRRFPFAIYYNLSGSTAEVVAVLDMRRDPAWTKERLTD